MSTVNIIIAPTTTIVLVMIMITIIITIIIIIIINSMIIFIKYFLARRGITATHVCYRGRPESRM